jgi:dCTP deaminase
VTSEGGKRIEAPERSGPKRRSRQASQGEAPAHAAVIDVPSAPSHGQDSANVSIVDGERDSIAPLASDIPVRTGIWSRQRLAKRLRDELLITDGNEESVFDTERLDASAYRLTMGEEVYVSPTNEDAHATVRLLKEREGFVIPPGQFAFLLSEEVVRVPDDALAFISLRSKKTKFRGLVNVSGFHADPGYYGRLIFAVFNAGPGDVHLRRGDDLFAIFFADLTEATDKPRSIKEGFMGIPADLISPISGKIQSFAGLEAKIDDVEEDITERLQKLERDNAIVRWATALILGALIALFVKFIVVDPHTGSHTQQIVPTEASHD